jgi:RNA polymerase sigma-70 factor (ECF subfamily)
VGVSESTVGRREATVNVAPRRPAPTALAQAQFVELYQARFAELAAQLYAFTGDGRETHDLVQEAFVRAWQRWDRVGAYEDPVGWVRRVAWNLAMNRHRRLRLHRVWADRHPQLEAAAPPLEPDRIVLVAALRRVPEQQRRALVLHYLADLSITDIAAESGVAEGTVKSWLHRGRNALAAHLAEFREGGSR